MQDNMMTVTGFFSGTGGIELGLAQTGRFRTVYANEWDTKASETYRLNFGDDHHVCEDINELDFTTLPESTLIGGGFPCQAFSVAGARQGFQDNKGRGNLFFRIAEAIEKKNPEVVFLENVKGLVGHDGGRTFTIILKQLEDLGYTTRWAVLNAKDYGNIPQGRERIYIVSFKDPHIAETFSFPEPIELTTRLEDVIDFEGQVDEKYYYTPQKNPKIWDTLAASITQEGVVYQWRRNYVRENKNKVSPTLTASMGTGGHNVPLVYTKHGIRKLTPRECFNLQGYPQDYKLPDQADSRLYKQAGNAVVVPVIRRIGEQICKTLDDSVV